MKSPHVTVVKWFLKGIRRFLFWVNEKFAWNVTLLETIKSSSMERKEKPMKKAGKKKAAKKKTAKRAKKKK